MQQAGSYAPVGSGFHQLLLRSSDRLVEIVVKQRSVSIGQPFHLFECFCDVSTRTFVTHEVQIWNPKSLLVRYTSEATDEFSDPTLNCLLELLVSNTYWGPRLYTILQSRAHRRLVKRQVSLGRLLNKPFYVLCRYMCGFELLHPPSALNVCKLSSFYRY